MSDHPPTHRRPNSPINSPHGTPVGSMDLTPGNGGLSSVGSPSATSSSVLASPPKLIDAINQLSRPAWRKHHDRLMGRGTIIGNGPGLFTPPPPLVHSASDVRLPPANEGTTMMTSVSHDSGLLPGGVSALRVEMDGLATLARRGRAARGQSKEATQTLHGLIMSLAGCAPQSLHCQKLVQLTEQLERDDPGAVKNDIARLEALYALFRAVNPDCVCKDPFAGEEHEYKHGEVVRIFRSQKPRMWVNARIVKLESSGWQMLCEYEIQEGDRIATVSSWFRVSSGHIHPLRHSVSGPASSSSSHDDHDKATCACLLLVYRAFFQMRGPDVLVTMLKQPNPRPLLPTIKEDPVVPPSSATTASSSTPPSTSDAPVTAAITNPSPTEVAAQEVEIFALLQEWCTLMVWKCDLIIREGDMECKGEMVVKDRIESGHGWWDNEMFMKTIELVATSRAISAQLIATLFWILPGNESVPVEKRTPGHRALQLDAFLATVAFQRSQLHLLQVLVLALTKSTVTHCKEGLEYLHMLVIRLDSNADMTLQQPGWYRWFSTLLLGVPGGPLYEGEEPMNNGDARLSVLSPENVSSNVQHTPDDFAAEDRALSTILQLSLSIVVYLLYRHFATFNPPGEKKGSSSGTNGTPLPPPTPSAVNGLTPPKSTAALLLDTVDSLEDVTGWGTDTVALVRILLSSFVIRIQTGARLFCNDPMHFCWPNLFDVLAVVENFLFYSGIDHDSTIRPIEERHWKHLGMHVTAGVNMSDDMGLVRTVVTFLQGLRTSELTDSADVYVEAEDRATIRALKRKTNKEIAFFEQTLSYFQLLGSKKQASDALKKLSVLLGKRKAKRAGQKTGLFSLRRSSIEKKLKSQVQTASVVAKATPSASETKVRVDMAKVFQPDEHLNRARRSFKSAHEANQFISQKRLTKDAISLAASVSQFQQSVAAAPAATNGPSATGTIHSGYHGAYYGHPSTRLMLTTGATHATRGNGPSLSPKNAAISPKNNKTNLQTMRVGIPPGNMYRSTVASPTNASATAAASTSSPLSPRQHKLPPALPSSHQSPPVVPSLPANVVAANDTPPPAVPALPLSVTKNGTLKRPPPPLPTSPVAPTTSLTNVFATPPPATATAATESVTTPAKAPDTTTPATPTTPVLTSAGPPEMVRSASIITTVTTAPVAPVVVPAKGHVSRPSMLIAPATTTTSTLPSGLVVSVAPPAPPPPRAVVTIHSSGPVPTQLITVDDPPEAIPAVRSTDINLDPLLSPRAASRPHAPPTFIKETSIATKGETFTVQANDISERSSSSPTHSPPSSAPNSLKSPSSPPPPSLMQLTQLMQTDGIMVSPVDGDETTTTLTMATTPTGGEHSHSNSNGAALICADCGIAVDVNDFYEYDSNVYCEADYLRRYCSCSDCKLPIEKNAPYVSFRGDTPAADGSDAPPEFMYHPACFRCLTCKVPFQRATDADPSSLEYGTFEGIFRHDNNVYCRNDYLREFGHPCYHCEKPIDGEMLIALGQRWHRDHFICGGGCGKEISSSTYFILTDTDRIRLKWLAKERGEILEDKKAMERRAVAAGTTVVELKGLSSTSGAPSPSSTVTNGAISNVTNGSSSKRGSKVMAIEDDPKVRPFCDACYGNLFKTVCFACSQDVVDNAIRVDKKSYHSTCYQCVTCFAEKDPDHLVTREHVQRWLTSMCGRLAFTATDTTNVLAKFRRTDGTMLAKLSDDDIKERFTGDAELAQMINHELASWRYRRATTIPLPMSPRVTGSGEHSGHHHTSSSDSKDTKGSSDGTGVLDAHGIKRILSMTPSPDQQLVYGRDKQLLCERHYHEAYAAKCYACQRPLTSSGRGSIVSSDGTISGITGGGTQANKSGAVQAGDHIYHASCVACAICDKLLGDDVFMDDSINTRLLCREHYRAAFGPTCFKCNKAISTGDVCTIQGNPFHIDCITCKICNTKLSPAGDGATIIPHPDSNVIGSFYCRDDYMKLFSAKCSQCNQPLTGRVVTVSDHKYHVSCLACSTCKLIFSGGHLAQLRNDTKTGLLYCVNHLPGVTAVNRASVAIPTTGSIGGPMNMAPKPPLAAAGTTSGALAAILAATNAIAAVTGATGTTPPATPAITPMTGSNGTPPLTSTPAVAATTPPKGPMPTVIAPSPVTSSPARPPAPTKFAPARPAPPPPTSSSSVSAVTSPSGTPVTAAGGSPKLASGFIPPSAHINPAKIAVVQGALVAAGGTPPGLSFAGAPPSPLLTINHNKLASSAPPSPIPSSSSASSSAPPSPIPSGGSSLVSASPVKSAGPNKLAPSRPPPARPT